ncbi:DMT family transporter [Halodurantibacterium flavum]|uniref:DMT family transporter n=1 Tax=Halodurantibacterium flavum TaxID=1382802 RepID=A0ABW4S303_9RHOB
MAIVKPAPAPTDVLRAALWMFGSVLSFSSMAVAARALSADFDTFEMMLYRSIIGIGIVLVAAWIAGTLREITTEAFGLQVVRNVSHFTGQNLWFFAVTVLPLAQVVALEFTSPLWVIILAPLFLGEKVTALRVGAAALGFVGILIVARPDFGNVDVGVMAAAGAAIGFAGSAVFTKVLTQRVTITAILFWLVTLQAIFALVISGADGDITWPRAENWPWIGVIGTAGLVAHFCLTRALGHAPALVVLPLDFVRLPLIALIGVLLYAEALEWPVALGAAVILGANFINIWAESRRTKMGKKIVTSP